MKPPPAKKVFKKRIICPVCGMVKVLYRKNGKYCSRKCLRKMANSRRHRRLHPLVRKQGARSRHSVPVRRA